MVSSHRGGIDIPLADLADLRAAVEAMVGALEPAARSLGGVATAAPFQRTLVSLADPERENRNDDHRPPSADPGSMLDCSEERVRESLRRIDDSPPGRLAWHRIDGDAAISRARTLDEERAAGQARGPLHGLPIGIKDMFDRRGRVARWGSPLREKATAAGEDSTAIVRLEKAGAVILGTQHMAEFALWPSGLNATAGVGRNPWSPEHVSGGSSSGAGMSVGAGHVALAIGSDTGGSIRLPAAMCGATGLKPTQYRVSAAGVMPFSPSLDCIGPIGRDVETCAAAFAVLAGADPRDSSCLDRPAPAVGRFTPDRRLRLAVPKLVVSELASQQAVECFHGARSVLEDAGVECIEVPMPDLDLAGSLAAIVLTVESAAVHRQWLAEPDAPYSRLARRRLSRGFLVAATDYYDALRLRGPILQQVLDESFRTADALLLPVAPDVAPRVTDLTEKDDLDIELLHARLSYWTRGINYYGLPALSVPAGAGTHGLPLAVQFVGRPLGETTLISLGRIFQKATDWHLRLRAR